MLAVGDAGNPTAVGVATAHPAEPAASSKQPLDIARPRAGRVGALKPRMTLPRCVLPGQTVMVTRRCLRRAKLLRPDAALN